MKATGRKKDVLRALAWDPGTTAVFVPIGVWLNRREGQRRVPQAGCSPKGR
ncbi:hypothetical protein [Yinghuangia sp. YIM S10712]|uniref:hypothetical protein n=1 Tax=Yinghuangia sp. YIM S10712 TaxID=3436930 RepID=UPI003F53490F